MGQPVRFEVSFDSVNVKTSRVSSKEISRYEFETPQHGNFQVSFSFSFVIFLVLFSTFLYEKLAYFGILIIMH